ncbi:MAG TPA: fatty acid CoA ligase family protein [Phycisphaerae bacterium]|nr:fatty acid CoA ligase family protein [Phycisphaerae bacterium]HRW51409.1 fatty acid CoA ligase family protein [Phycisphaerae bacterium]
MIFNGAPAPETAQAVSSVNVAAHLPRMAALQPETPALIWRSGRAGDGRATYARLTFRQLDEESDRYARGFESIGIRRGVRTILMVRPSPEFFALTFALYKIGAVPVLIDPGMGKLRMVDCLRSIEAEAFIGIPIAHVLRRMFPSAFRQVHACVTVGRRFGWGGHRLDALRGDAWERYQMAETRPTDPAAIIFTTGSTGPPKAVLYEHAMFDAQVRILRDQFGIQPGEVDLPTFPLFALFDPALGMTAVIPEMDPTRPAFVDPTRIIEAIRDQNITHMFGSPALLNRVSRYGEANDIRLPSLRRVISAGAPVPPVTLRRMRKMLNADTQVFTPYGATEALPVASIGSHEILDETAAVSEQGGGTCVGRPVPGAEVRVIRISDGPIAEWSDDLCVKTGEIGEIVVKGQVVTRRYLTSETATRQAKIPEGDVVWHRMGDVGRLDNEGRIWFCGRKAHRVVTPAGVLFTVPCETIFNRHPKVFRTALVGVGEPPNQRPVLWVELDAEVTTRSERRRPETILAELRRTGADHAITRSIADFRIHPRFPVDIRHNAKIFREKLAIQAARG